MAEQQSRPGPEQDDVERAEEAQPASEESGEQLEPENADSAETEEGGPDELAKVEAKAKEYWNQYLRARADLDNLRKRASRDVEQAHKFAIERFVSDLLQVKDSLEQGLEAAREDDTGSEKLIEGKELTLKMLEKVFRDHGVEEINPVGEKFDPSHHEAMTTQPSKEHEPDTVVMVLQKGYLLNDRLVRPARVVVSRPEEGGGDA